MNSITQKNGKTKQTDYVLTPMLDELVRNVEFLGENVWFPSGAITILGGRKRCGKSTLALYELRDSRPWARKSSSCSERTMPVS